MSSEPARPYVPNQTRKGKEEPYKHSWWYQCIPDTCRGGGCCLPAISRGQPSLRSSRVPCFRPTANYTE